jgi:branched-chain amino acid transport system permease protein
VSELLSAIISGVAQGVPLFIVASGLTLIFGVLRILNFAHGAFFMYGAFFLVMVLGGKGISLPVFLLAATAAGVALALVGALSDTVVFRKLYGLDHMTTLLASYALLIAMDGLALMIWGNKPRAQTAPEGLGGSFELGPIRVASYDVLLLVIGLIIGVALFVVLQKTPVGKIVRAVSIDEQMARALGVRARYVQVGVFAAGAALAGLAGALMAPLVSVDVGLAPTFAIQSFAIVIIGGLGSIGGALVAALILGIADSLAVNFVPELAGFSLYIAVALVLLLRPQGLAKKTVGSH